jgi:hypothetical protein
MPSPFDLIGKPVLENPKGEPVEGAFSCSECYSVVGDARYLDEVELLTWKCPEGHINSIKMRLE